MNPPFFPWHKLTAFLWFVSKNRKCHLALAASIRERQSNTAAYKLMTRKTNEVRKTKRNVEGCPCRGRIISNRLHYQNWGGQSCVMAAGWTRQNQDEQYQLFYCLAVPSFICSQLTNVESVTFCLALSVCVSVSLGSPISLTLKDRWCDLSSCWRPSACSNDSWQWITVLINIILYSRSKFWIAFPVYFTTRWLTNIFY